MRKKRKKGGRHPKEKEDYFGRVYRKFDGKRFDKKEMTLSLKVAKELQAKWQNKGYYVRIVRKIPRKRKDGYISIEADCRYVIFVRKRK